MTEFYWTVNLRSLMNFLSNRLTPHAQKDIREDAHQVLELFRQFYPNISEAWQARDKFIKDTLKGWRNDKKDKEAHQES